MAKKLKSTNGTYPIPERLTRWRAVVYFSFIHSVGLIGTPLYMHFYGVTRGEWFLFWVYFACSSLAITIGYHRLFAHVTFKPKNWIRFFLLYFGASTFEQSALKWASQHRQHHQFTDTDQDPYNIKRGFWYAHIGWIMFWKHRVNYDNVPDLQASKLVMHQHYNYSIWSVGSGIVIPVIIGAFMGKALGAFIMAVCLRLVLVMHSAFFINSYAHMFGSRGYDSTISARDHWLGGILTNGEGYHNFHHKFPNDYRNGIRWYHWDPSKWIIFLLGKLGLAYDLKRTPESLIQAQRALAASQK